MSMELHSSDSLVSQGHESLFEDGPPVDGPSVLKRPLFCHHNVNDLVQPTYTFTLLSVLVDGKSVLLMVKLKSSLLRLAL